MNRLMLVLREPPLGADEILVFRDEAISGAIMERPELNRTSGTHCSGEINLLVIRDPDRFSRKLVDQLILTEEFEQAGVQLIHRFYLADTS